MQSQIKTTLTAVSQKFLLISSLEVMDLKLSLKPKKQIEQVPDQQAPKPAPSRVKPQKKVKPAKNKARKVRVKKASRGLLPNIKIAPKLLAGFLIIAVLSAAMGIFASYSLSTVSTASQNMYAKILLPTKNIYDMMVIIQTQTTNLRQSLLSDKDEMAASYLSSVETCTNKIDTNISMIQSLIPDDKQGDYNTYMTSYANYKDKLANVIEQIGGWKQRSCDRRPHQLWRFPLS